MALSGLDHNKLGEDIRRLDTDLAVISIGELRRDARKRFSKTALYGISNQALPQK